MTNEAKVEAVTEVRAADKAISELPPEAAWKLLEHVKWDVDLAITAVKIRASWITDLIGPLPEPKRVSA